MPPKTVQSFVEKIRKSQRKKGHGKVRFWTPRELAEFFVKYFKIKHPMNFEAIKRLCADAGIKLEPTTDSGKLRGANCSYNGSVLIYYRTTDAPVSLVHTVLHELYEVIDPNQKNGSAPKFRERREVDLEADEFASNVQVPFKEVKKWIKRNGVDLLALRKHFDCSYASAMFRLADVLCEINLPGKREKLPIIFLLYERDFVKGDRPKRKSRLKLKFYKKTKGFPFRMKKAEVESVEVEIDKTRKKLWFLVSKDEEMFLEKIPFHFNGTTMTTNILVQTVVWRSFHNGKPAKSLVQIVPERFGVLKNLFKTSNN